tara:strand:- start:1409 stop:2545 length:1137 start_codon:yes stop_codon:yes gene_type:complete
MALPKATYSVPKTPRVYIDNLLFAKAMNIKVNFGDLLRVAENDTSPTFFNNIAERRRIWDLDPSRYVTIKNTDVSIKKIATEFYITQDYGDSIRPFLNLMHTSNYAALFNHNLHTGSDSPVTLDVFYNGQSSNDSSGNVLGTGGTPGSTPIVGQFGQDVDEDGFILSGINLNASEDEGQLHQFDFVIKPSDADYLPGEFSYNIGSFSVGTYLDFPFAPDIEVKMSYSHEGVSNKRTVAGKDLTHINYTGAPNWGNLAPFTTSKGATDNFIGVNYTGRKSWDMKFSYIDKTDMFNAIQSGSTAGGYFRVVDGFSVGLKTESSILATYLNRTLSGSLKHILQPDNTRNEFYIVKLDQKSTKINQVAPGTFEINLKFVQVW